MFKDVCVVVVFKGREFYYLLLLEILCKYICIYIMCSLSTKIRRCMDIRYITVWISILQCIDDK